MSTSFGQDFVKTNITRVHLSENHGSPYLTIWAERRGAGIYLDLTFSEAQLAQIEEAIASFLHERAVERLMAECTEQVCREQGCPEHPIHDGADHTYEQHHSPEDHVGENECRCSIYVDELAVERVMSNE